MIYIYYVHRNFFLEVYLIFFFWYYSLAKIICFQRQMQTILKKKMNMQIAISFEKLSKIGILTKNYQ